MARPKAVPVVAATEPEPMTEREVETIDALEEAIATLPGGGAETTVRFCLRDPEKHGLKYLDTQMLTEDFEIEQTAVKLLQERGVTGDAKVIVTFKYPRGVKDRDGKGSTSRSFDVVVPPAPAILRKGTDGEGGLTNPTIVSLMIELATLKGTLQGMTAGGGGGSGMAPGSVADQLSMFERIAGIFKSLQPAGEASGLALAREALGFINEAKALAPEPAVEDAGMLLAREGIGLVKTIATEHPEAVEQFMKGRGQPATNPARQLPPAPVKPVGPPEPPWKTETRKWLPGLIEEAKVGSDPAKVADNALTQLEQQYPKVVYDLIADKAEGATFVAWAWAKGVEAFPELAPHQAWATQFLQAVKDELIGGDDVPPEGGE